MTKLFEDFKKEHPRIAEAMGIIGMTHEEYCERYNREMFRWICDPQRFSMGGSTAPLPFPGAWYSSSTATKE